MKYIIESEDETEFRLCFNGPKLYSALWEFRQFLRSKWKYNDTENKAWLEAANELINILTDYGIDIEEDYN